MKLTKANLTFIDTYLKNSGILFVDVRMELVDHVASALEKRMQENKESFYDAFKGFMVRHKRDITKDYEQLRRKLQLRSFKVIGRELIKPRMMLLFILLLGGIKGYETYFSATFPYVLFMFLCLLLVFIVLIVARVIYKNMRISSLEFLTSPLLILAYALQAFSNTWRIDFFNSQAWSFPMHLATTLFCCVLLSVLAVFFRIRKVYRLKYF